MKFKVFFIKRKHIYYSVLILLVFIFFIIFTNLKPKDISFPTFSMNLDKEAYKADLTGDGNNDILYITTLKDKYHLQVNTEKDSIFIQPNKNINTLGTYTPYWSARIKLLDMNRDKIPEIFIQASEKNKPIQHGFLYNNGKFETIFSSHNNILGFIDFSNNKTPKLISGNISKNGLEFYNYILIQNELKKYTYNYEENFVGKDVILSFINLVTTNTSSSYITDKNLFSNDTDKSSLYVTDALITSDINYTFQDAQFIDIKSDTNGNPSQIQWILNFRGISKNAPSSVKNYTLKLLLKSDKSSNDSYHYKIFSISQIQ
ncbi:VCBS repeat-containing protein [Clostridium sp. MB40-C1]|uniref:VCBS repeat-containing protein n=1 Tax=Clostridium sp. MB40-C1 TaxID=3070996 RepID=UPI0027E20D5D|nr:VCBS repeat-containing protein [Clostridium sp. MB40-C1]WMJ79471.1 VCBS repeat-containing protein [Clostridium sp. MB40-C1]